MNEFKGTKGRLKVKICYYSKPIIKIENESREVFAEILFRDNYVHLYGYEMANAQLISCSPEMLEMLKELRKRVDFGYSVWGNDEGFIISEKLDNLIKKATTI